MNGQNIAFSDLLSASLVTLIPTIDLSQQNNQRKSSSERTTVEPPDNYGPKHWQNTFATHRGFVISRVFFIYFITAGLQKNISLYRGLRYIEVPLYPVALLWMITVKDSISWPFTDLNKAKLYSIRNNQQKHNSVMPAFMWHSVAFPTCAETLLVLTARTTT